MNPEIAEVRILLRFASSKLTEKERMAVMGWLNDVPDTETCKLMRTTRGGVWMLRQNGLKKMRRRLVMLGIRSSDQLLSRERVA